MRSAALASLLLPVTSVLSHPTWPNITERYVGPFPVPPNSVFMTAHYSGSCAEPGDQDTLSGAASDLGSCMHAPNEQANSGSVAFAFDGYTDANGNTYKWKLYGSADCSSAIMKMGEGPGCINAEEGQHFGGMIVYT